MRSSKGFASALNAILVMLLALASTGQRNPADLTGNDHTRYYAANGQTDASPGSYARALTIKSGAGGNFNETRGGRLADAEIDSEHDPNTIVVSKTEGQFASIQSAINSITDASSTNPYVVYFQPGVYHEKVTLSKSYVSLVGVQPNGAGIPEALNSGAIITYASSGVGGDLMTLLISSGGETDLEGITIANMTIVNTSPLRTGPAQEALDIGRGDRDQRSHKILIRNCSFYGEQDTVFVNNGNPIFQDCYIEGENDICSIADDAIFRNVYFYCDTEHGGRHPLWIGKSDNSAFSVSFEYCTFDKKIPGKSLSGGIGYFAHNNVTANFYNCNVMPNCATPYTWDFGNCTGCTVNLFGTNGERWDANRGPSSTVNAIAQPPLSVEYQGIEINDMQLIKDRWAAEGPRFAMYKRRTGHTAANNDEAGTFRFYADNESLADKEVARIQSLITDVTAGEEEGVIDFYTVTSGTLIKAFRMTPDGKLALKNNETIDNNIDDLITLTGNVKASGGLNVGSATGARAGDGKFGGDITIGGNDLFFGTGAHLTADGSRLSLINRHLDLKAAYGILLGGAGSTQHSILAHAADSDRTGDVTVSSMGSVVVNLDTDNNDSGSYFSINNNVENYEDTGSIFQVADTGNVTVKGDVAASGKKITARVFDVEHYGVLPAASSEYRGQIALIEGRTGRGDALYICLKSRDGTYSWEMIAGTP